jgi:hypothetical protein
MLFILDLPLPDLPINSTCHSAYNPALSIPFSSSSWLSADM